MKLSLEQQIDREERLLEEKLNKLKQLRAKKLEKERKQQAAKERVLGYGILKALEEDDSLTWDAVLQIIDKHIVKKTERQLLGLQVEESSSGKKVANKVKKPQQQVAGNQTNNSEVNEFKKTSPKSEKVITQTRIEEKQSAKRVINPLPMTNSQDELADEFFFNDDYEELKTGGERGL